MEKMPSFPIEAQLGRKTNRSFFGQSKKGSKEGSGHGELSSNGRSVLRSASFAWKCLIENSASCIVKQVLNISSLKGLKDTWLPLVLLSGLVHKTVAVDFTPVNRIFEDDGMRMIAIGLSLGADGDALRCPASPVTTPVSLRMMCYATAFYGFVLALLVIWLSWRKFLFAFYLRRQIKRAKMWNAVSSPSSSPTSKAVDERAKTFPTDLASDRGCVVVSPILEHGGMFLQHRGYRLSFMGCLVYALVAASIVFSVILPFLSGFAASSITPSQSLSKHVPPSFYRDFNGLAPVSAEMTETILLNYGALSSSPHCIKLRVYIFAVCFIWCLAWMVGVHLWRHSIYSLLFTPACLENCTHLMLDRISQKILQSPNPRSKPTAQTPEGHQLRAGLEILRNRSDLGEPPLMSGFTKVSALPHALGRFAEISRIRLVYDKSRGYFLPMAAIHERQARAAALCLSNALEKFEAFEEETSKSGFLESLASNMLPDDEVLYRLEADGGLGLGWNIRPLSSLVVASFLQDEFYLVTLMALWYQVFSLNSMQAAILLILPIFELSFGVYSLRKGEQQLVGIVERELSKLKNHKTLCMRLKRVSHGSKPEGHSPVFVLKLTRASEIVPGDVVLLQPGDEVPCDLLLVHGSVSLDESHLTGETEPVVKTPLQTQPHHRSAVSIDSDVDSARVAEDEVLDPSSVFGNTVGCIYAGSKIMHTSCRGDIASEIFDNKSQRPDGTFEEEIQEPVAFLLDDQCCWGIAVRTHGETMRGQLLRQLDLPTITRFKYHAQFPYVVIIVTLFAFALIAIQSVFTRSFVDIFRFGVEKLLRMLPLYLPALWGICASLNAKRLSTGRCKKNLSYPQSYRATAVLPGLLPLAAKVRVICFDKTGTITQNSLALLGIHTVADGSFKNLVVFNPEDDARLTDSVSLEPSGEHDLPMSLTMRSLAGKLKPSVLQCLACCNSLHFTPHGMAEWTRSQQAAFKDKDVFTAEELRSISELVEQHSDAYIDGVDLEKQALRYSGFTLVELVSSSLAQVERRGLVRATTAWAAEMQKSSKTRRFIMPQDGDKHPMLEVVRSYCFDHSTGMMSVIVRECRDTGGCQGQRGYVFCKGSYEEVAKACLKSSVPFDFVSRARKYAKDGIYLIGAAYRELTHEEMSGLDNGNLNVSRVEVESGLSCLGLVLFRNEMRSDADEAIEELSQGGIRCVMLTGDNPYTAVAVARRARMIRSVSKSHGFPRRNHSLCVQTSMASESTTPVLLGNAVLEPHESPVQGSIQAHYVKWTDVDTGKEVDPWKVYYTDEYKELVITMVAAKLLMREADAELLPSSEGEGEEVLEDSWRRKSMYEALREHEERRALLPQQTDWQCKTPSLFDRIFFRIRVFSRMSPMGKKLIILHFQRRGLTTCMVGDGSNDSLAFRQADVGIEMGQVQPAPFSAPFAIFHASGEQKTLGESTGALGKDGVRGIVDIIRVGRCSLSTAMAIFKLHVSYGLLAATTSLLVVIAQYAGMNNTAALFLDVVVLLGLSGAMLFSSPVSSPLTKKSPQSSPFAAAIILSVLSLVFVDLVAFALLLYLFYGPGGFPPPCYWVQSHMQDALENRLPPPNAESEKVLKEKELELREEEQLMHVMENALNQKAKLLEQEEKKILGEKVVLETRMAPVENGHPPQSRAGPLLVGIPGTPKQKLHSSADEERDGLAEARSISMRQKAHSSQLNGVSTIDLKKDLFGSGKLGQRQTELGTNLLPVSFLQSVSSSSFFENTSSQGDICSNDGHAEAAVIFVWMGICTLHAGMLFISGNVFRKPAWKNRVLLPFSLLISAFFVYIMLVPPGPLTCAFNINCTLEAAQALHNHPLYPVAKFMAADSAASTLHDATEGSPTFEAVATKAAAEAQQKHHTWLPSGYLVEPHIADAAKFVKLLEASARHLWTYDEATKLSRWFSHALLYVLALMCIINTFIQFVCLHEGTLAEWWRRRRPRWTRGEPVPL